VVEELFKLPGPDRTLDAARGLIRPAWAKLLGGWSGAAYRDLIPADSAAEADLFEWAARTLQLYYAVEDPRRLDPEGVEVKLRGTVAGVPTVCILDRVDTVEVEGTPRTYISDLKTGRQPVRDDGTPTPWAADAFSAMRIYALALAELRDTRAHQLRLVYLQAGSPAGVMRLNVTDDLLSATAAELAETWAAITAAHRNRDFPTRRTKLCDWCAYREICPEFTVTDPAPAENPVPQPARRATPVALGPDPFDLG